MGNLWQTVYDWAETTVAVAAVEVSSSDDSSFKSAILIALNVTTICWKKMVSFQVHLRLQVGQTYPNTKLLLVGQVLLLKPVLHCCQHNDQFFALRIFGALCRSTCFGFRHLSGGRCLWHPSGDFSFRQNGSKACLKFKRCLFDSPPLWWGAAHLSQK